MIGYGFLALNRSYYLSKYFWKIVASQSAKKKNTNERKFQVVRGK